MSPQSKRDVTSGNNGGEAVWGWRRRWWGWGDAGGGAIWTRQQLVESDGAGVCGGKGAFRVTAAGLQAGEPVRRSAGYFARRSDIVDDTAAFRTLGVFICAIRANKVAGHTAYLRFS